MLELKYLLLIFLWALLGVASAALAKDRGRDPFSWFFIGMFVGLFGILFLFILPNKKNKDEEENLAYLEEINHPQGENLDKKWYFLDEKKEHKGPFTLMTIQMLIKEKKLERNPYIWEETLDNWIRIKDLNDK
jgi:hypothetical protein